MSDMSDWKGYFSRSGHTADALSGFRVEGVNGLKYILNIEILYQMFKSRLEAEYAHAQQNQKPTIKIETHGEAGYGKTTIFTPIKEEDNALHAQQAKKPTTNAEGIKAWHVDWGKKEPQAIKEEDC